MPLIVKYLKKIKIFTYKKKFKFILIHSYYFYKKENKLCH